MKKLFAAKTARAITGLMILCLLALVIANTNIAAWSDDRVTSKLPDFSDVPATHWASTHITRLTYEGAITGYPDGTFKPSSNITRAEFVAVVVRALFPKDIPANAPAGQHWATNIMKKAYDSSLLETGEFAQVTWGDPINRQEMAKIMARGAQFVLKEAQEDKTSTFTSKITDYNATPEAYRPYVAQVYAKGIVTGYPDGSFGGSKQATRAEAATMVVRLIDPVYRETVALSTEVQGGAQIAFDPATDVAEDGRMKLVKAEEYMMKTLQSLRFYEENGKFYFEGYVTEVPEGFRNWLNISIGVDQGIGSSYGSYPLRAQLPLTKIGPFKEEIKDVSSREQIINVLITIHIDAPSHTNTTFDQYGYEVIWVIDTSNDNRIEVYDYTTYRKEASKFYDFSTIFQW